MVPTFLLALAALHAPGVLWLPLRELPTVPLHMDSSYPTYISSNRSLVASKHGHHPAHGISPTSGIHVELHDRDHRMQLSIVPYCSTVCAHPSGVGPAALRPRCFVLLRSEIMIGRARGRLIKQIYNVGTHRSLRALNLCYSSAPLGQVTDFTFFKVRIQHVDVQY